VLARLMQTDLTVMISGEIGNRQGAGGAQRCTITASDGAGRSSPSTWHPFRATSSSPSCSATRKGAFTGANTRVPGASSRPRAARSSWTRSATCRWRRRPGCCGCCSRANTPLSRPHPDQTDVRIIAATNKDLRILIQQGLFREDLFFRLNVVPLRIPPLRERVEDVPDLIRHFFTQAEREGLPPKQLDQAALERVKRYRWPGNVRELENPRPPAGRALSAGDHLGLRWSRRSSPSLPRCRQPTSRRPRRGYRPRSSAIWPPILPTSGKVCRPPGSTHRILREIEHPLLTVTLAATRGNQIRAADLLGVNRNTPAQEDPRSGNSGVPIRRISPG